ncbi:O-antigen ligase family protein [Mucilaginibacter sp. AW1-3]
MDLKVTVEAWGGFKVFDLFCFYCLVFLLKDFTTINLSQRNNFYLALFVLLCIIILIGGLASEFPNKTYLNIIKILPIFIFARFLLTECYKDPTFHSRAIKAIKIGYLGALAFLFVQFVIGIKFTFYPGLNPNVVDPVFHIVRYPGVFYDSQAHGQYLAMGSFLFLYTEPGETRKNVILNYGVFVLAIIAISLAGSRAAFGGFAIGAFLTFLIVAKQYRVYGVIALVIGYFIFTNLSIHNGVFDRSKNLSEDFLFRQGIWNEAFDISKKHPYLGIGSGNYQNYVIRHNQGQYLEIEDGQLVYFDQPENGYLKIMVELGFIGFAVFALFIIVPLIKGFTLFLKGLVDKQIAFLIAGVISWLVAFNTVYSIYDNRILIMVTVLLVLIISYPPKKQHEYPLVEKSEI